MTTIDRRYPAIQGEFEFEDELEDEFEGEGEYEDEFEAEGEDEAFLGALGGIARSFLSEGESEEEFEFEFEAEAEYEGEEELEDEFEAEAEEEAEGFVNPVRRVYRDAELMAHLAKQAAASESEAEAEQFIGALVPLAARLIPRAASVLAKNAPALIRGAGKIVRNLRRNPTTRRLVSAMPVVLQRTAQSLADQAANGTPIDGVQIARTLGTITGRVLSGPNAPGALRAVDVFNRRYHRRARWDRRRQGQYRGTSTAPRYRGRPVNRAPQRRTTQSRAGRRARRR